VIAGNRTSLPEVVGDAGLLVDPFDPHAIARALETMLSDDTLRESLSKMGMERAREFSWIECARKTLAVFEKIMEKEERVL
jgi:glycosyltransferase involved in cell wall biosynthesis